MVAFIRTWRDRVLSSRFDFVPPSFFLELIRNYTGFCATEEKHKFVFSTAIKTQFLHRPGWYTHVDYIYSPVIIKKCHWVGLIIYLKMAVIYVVDSNSGFPSTDDVISYLTPISVMLPHLISRFCIVSNPGSMNYQPLPISRIGSQILLEHPGMYTYTYIFVVRIKFC